MKKAPDVQIKKRKDGRYLVARRGGGTINGYEKTKVLLEAGLIKTKLPAEAPAEPAAAEASASETESAEASETEETKE